MTEPTRLAVLVVDDEEGIRRSLQRLLKPLDIELHLAANGTEGLEIMRHEQIALVISDQRMPGMSGVELLTASREFSPRTIRILLTGYADVEATVAAINSGEIKYYLNKPWDDELLLSRIRESLDLYRTSVENERLNELTRHQNRQLRQLNVTLNERVKEQTVEIRRQHEELKESFMETIKAFSTIIEMRFQDIGSHSQRVANLVKRMLPGMELEDQEFQDIVVAAFLHDIGKISLPDRVARKADESSASDQELIERHPILGQSCVYNITGFENIGLIIRHHHEDYDGTGYPDSLRDVSIPLGARIIRLVDAFDHVAFKDGYPDLKTLNQSAAYIVQHSGSKFDPAMVKRFIDLDIARQLYHGDVTDIVGLKPADLVEGMIVAQDIRTRNGMFLLPKGARLSRGMISRVRKIHAVDPIADAIRVYKQPKRKKGEYVPA